jgi:hypothetical protein
MGFLDKLGISKVEEDGEAAPAKEKKARAPKQVKQKAVQAESGGRLGRALKKVPGVEAEALPSDEERLARERHQTIIMAWQYLRAMIDKGVKEFYAQGDSPLLEEHVERPTLDALKNHLTDLRAKGIYWEQPKRRQSTHPEVKVIDEQLDGDNIPVEFTVEERFYDFSLFQQIEFDAAGGPRVVDERRGEGSQVVLKAKVKVEGDQGFRLVSIERVDHAVL